MFQQPFRALGSEANRRDPVFRAQFLTKNANEDGFSGRFRSTDGLFRNSVGNYH